MYAYQLIDAEELTSLDLREWSAAVARCKMAVIATRVTLNGHASTAEAVYVPQHGLIGIAWGADADFSDASTLEGGLTAWVAGISA